jgi:hypothetical protein
MDKENKNIDELRKKLVIDNINKEISNLKENINKAKTTLSMKKNEMSRYQAEYNEKQKRCSNLTDLIVGAENFCKARRLEIAAFEKQIILKNENLKLCTTEVKKGKK